MEASVLGRSIPHIENIIENQLYAVIKKKHTLPSFKMRGAPIFMRKSMLNILEDSPPESTVPLFPAKLYVTLISCSRLQVSLFICLLYVQKRIRG